MRLHVQIFPARLHQHQWWKGFSHCFFTHVPQIWREKSIFKEPYLSISPLRDTTKQGAVANTVIIVVLLWLLVTVWSICLRMSDIIIMTSVLFRGKSLFALPQAAAFQENWNIGCFKCLNTSPMLSFFWRGQPHLVFRTSLWNVCCHNNTVVGNEFHLCYQSI